MSANAPFVDSLEVPALTKAHLVGLLADQLGLNGREATDMMEGFFELVQASLARGEDVKLAGFGSFEIHHKGARPGRNPRTGEEVQIVPRRVVRFSAGPKFKRRLAQQSLAGIPERSQRDVRRFRSTSPEPTQQPVGS